MKFNLIKSRMIASGWNFAILPAAVCVVWLAFISGSAQLKNDKRITSIQLGSAAEGARVTLVSDSGLNDYEAFRRGERFYVRIPLAEFASGQPGFHGDGFDDIQVQRIGDSLVVSFKLQPGASARVDQHGNRLEVIFTSIARTQRPGIASGAANRGTTSTAVNDRNPDRQRDAAGPAPIDSSQTSRQRFVNERQKVRDSSQRQPTTRANIEGNSRETINTANTATPSQPSSIVSPTPQQNNSAWTSSPVTTGTSETSLSKSSGSANSSGLAGKNQNQTTSWLAANRKTALLGALTLAAVAALFAFFLYRRPRIKAHANRVKPALSQPKYSSDDEHDVFSSKTGVEVERPSPEAAGTFSSEAEEIPEWPRPPVEPALASAHVAAANGAGKSPPFPAQTFVTKGEASSEEREVFEL